MLVQLRALKAALLVEGVGGGGKEVEGLKEENKRLKEENGKLRYRVEHLVRALEAEEEKVGKLSA